MYFRVFARPFSPFPAPLKIRPFAALFMPLPLLLVCTAVSAQAQTATHTEPTAFQPGTPSTSVSQSQAFAAKLDKPDGNGWQVRVHTAALHGDRSHLSAMVAAFKNPPDAKFWGTAPVIRVSLLHSFALLGATEALSALDEAIAGDLDTSRASPEDNLEVVLDTKAVKARLQAQSATVGIKDSKARAGALVTSYLQQLGLTSGGVNAAVAPYRIALVQFRAHPGGSDIPPPPAPLELYAMRELADVIYHGSYSDYIGVPEISQIDFALDPGAGLKYQIATLSPEQRIQALVDLLAAEKIADDKAKYAEQLLSDMGEAARPAITAKLQDAKLHPEQYSDQAGNHAGPSLLYDVLKSLDLQAKDLGDQEFVVGY